MVRRTTSGVARTHRIIVKVHHHQPVDSFSARKEPLDLAVGHGLPLVVREQPAQPLEADVA
eukprot:7094237-Prymnesium_polylepis.1